MKKQTFRNCTLDIENHLKKGRAKKYNECIIGQTNNAKRTLFIKCNLPIQSSWYIYRNVKSDKLAKKIVKYFVCKGMKQYSMLVPHNSTYIFCYIHAKPEQRTF